MSNPWDYDIDETCPICGNDATECECAICPECGVQGDPSCVAQGGHWDMYVENLKAELFEQPEIDAILWDHDEETMKLLRRALFQLRQSSGLHADWPARKQAIEDIEAMLVKHGEAGRSLPYAS